MHCFLVENMLCYQIYILTSLCTCISACNDQVNQNMIDITYDSKSGDALFSFNSKLKIKLAENFLRFLFIVWILLRKKQQRNLHVYSRKINIRKI